MDIFRKLGAVIAVLGAAFGGYFFIDGNYARSSEMQIVEYRIDYMELKNRYNWVQERLWKLEDRYGGEGVPQASQSAKEEYRALQAELIALRQRIGQLGGVMVKP